MNREPPNAAAAPARYSHVAIALHWLMALAIVGLLGVGMWMTDLPASPQKIQIYGWHKWIGLTVLGLALLRVLWRVHRRPPAAMPGMPRWQERAAASVHGLLYALMFAMPLSGWLLNSATGFPLTWFGLFKVPALIARNRDAIAFWEQVHEYLAWALMALIALHVAGALKHHFIDRDGLLQRMWPQRRGSASNGGKS